MFYTGNTGTEDSVPHVEGIKIVRTLVYQLKLPHHKYEDFFGNPFNNNTV